MDSIFGGPKIDKKADEAAKAEKKRLAAEAAELKRTEEEEKDARMRGQRGRRALSQGPLTGYGQPTLMA